MKKYLNNYISNCLALVCLIVACKPQTEQAGNSFLLAQVGDEKLTTNELEAVSATWPPDTDSASNAKAFVKAWVQETYLHQLAKQSLEEEMPEIEITVNNYKKSMMIAAFEQKLLNEMQAIEPSESEIENFYNQNKPLFVNQQGMFKGRFVLVPVSAPQQQKLTKLLSSNKPADLQSLEDYCLQYAIKFDIGDSTWYQTDKMGNSISEMMNQKLNANTIGYYQITDSLFSLHVKLKTFLPAGATAPLNSQHATIKQMLQLQYNRLRINETKDKMIETGISKKKIKIYEN